MASPSADAFLIESPLIRTTSRPLRSYKLNNDAYALSLASLPGCYAASASAPSNIIDLLDKTTLRRIQSLPGHELATTSLKSVENIAGHNAPCLVSSGKDGSVKVWDGRSRDYSIKSPFSHPVFLMKAVTDEITKSSDKSWKRILLPLL